MGTNYLAPTWRQPENINKDKLSNYSITYDGGNDYITIDDNIFSGLETWSMAGFYNLSTLSVDNAIFGKYGNSPQKVWKFTSTNTTILGQPSWMEIIVERCFS